MSGDRPEDVDTIFGQIVSDWQAEGTAPRWPEPSGRAAPTDPGDHFVPPEPPPLPRLRRRTLLGLVMLALGVLLVAAPGLVGVSDQTGLLLGLVALTSGIGWLVLGLRQDPPPDSGADDGAVL